MRYKIKSIYTVVQHTTKDETVDNSFMADFYKDYKDTTSHNYYTYVAYAEEYDISKEAEDKLIKFDAFSKYIKNGDIVETEIDEQIKIVEDEFFGELTYLIGPNIKFKDSKDYLRFLTDNFKEEIDKEIILKMYNTYKTDTLTRLEDNNTLLKFGVDVNNIGKIINKAMFLNKKLFWYPVFLEELDVNLQFKVMLKLAADGISGDEVRDNPYLLVKYTQDTNLISKFDKILLNKNLYIKTEKEAQQRLIYIIYGFLLKQYKENGNICYPLDKYKDIIEFYNSVTIFNYYYIDNRIRECFIKLGEKDIVNAVNNSKDLIIYNNCIYLIKNYFIEQDLCKKISEKNNEKNVDNVVVSKNALTVEQNKALANVLNNKLSVVNGGPGTGKSFLISNTIRHILETQPDKTILVVSLTGRVVNNLKYNLNCANPKVRFLTIHSALNLNLFNNNNILNDIEEDYILVDECSMISVNLFKYIFSHISSDAHICLFGDYNQLPPIGAGNVFKDLCNCKNVIKTTLTEIFRTKNPTITNNAYAVISGKGLNALEQDNSFYILTNVQNKTLNKNVYKIVGNFLRQRNENLDNVMILTGSRHSASVINKSIQKHLNTNSKKITLGNKTFKIGDKVMCIKNDKTNEIMNGQVGVVVSINNNVITVEYSNDIKVFYDKSDVKNIDLAYAITIHKAQGSQYKNVFVILTAEEEKMLNRKLLYTAITRSKENVIISGEKEVIEKCIESDKDDAYSNIKYLIEEEKED